MVAGEAVSGFPFGNRVMVQHAALCGQSKSAFSSISIFETKNSNLETPALFDSCYRLLTREFNGAMGGFVAGLTNRQRIKLATNLRRLAGEVMPAAEWDASQRPREPWRPRQPHRHLARGRHGVQDHILQVERA